MSRTPKLQAAQAVDTSDATNLIANDANSATALAVLTNKINAETSVLAMQLGYDGDLSIGSLEDGIRFYQRRTVEACLELGKRLLLLKQQVRIEEGHGTFEARIELLGFSTRSATRFMQASAKSAKSANLALLSTKVKSASAFLELVMVDDEDALKAISEMDDIDRMPASELRKTIRSLKGDNAANDRLLENQAKKIRKLEREAEKYTPDEVEQQLRKSLSDAELQATATLDGDLRVAIEKMMAHGEEHGKSYAELLAGHLLQVEASCQALREQFGINRALDDVPAWMTNTAGPAAK